MASLLCRIWHYNCLPCIATRYVLALTLCLGLTCSVLLRTIMNVAIVEIVSPMEKHQNGSSKVTLTLATYVRTNYVHNNFCFMV